MQPIPASRVIFATVPLGTVKGAQIVFPIDKFLFDKEIVGIETYNATQQATSPTGSPVVSSADAIKITITLVRRSAEIHHNIPNNLLNTLSLFGLWKAIPPTVIDWNSSYIRVTDTLAAAATFVVPLIVHYIPKDV